MKYIVGAFTTMVLVAGVGLGGCAPVNNPNTISRNQAGQVVPVEFGTLTSMRVVDIAPGQTRVGTIAGAALGAIGGGQIGRSSAANAAGAIAGGVAGGVVGSALQGSQRTPGLELEIRLDSGAVVAVVQPGDPRDFRIGDRVRLTGTDSNARVTR